MILLLRAIPAPQILVTPAANTDTCTYRDPLLHRKLVEYTAAQSIFFRGLGPDREQFLLFDLPARLGHGMHDPGGAGPGRPARFRPNHHGILILKGLYSSVRANSPDYHPEFIVYRHATLDIDLIIMLAY